MGQTCQNQKQATLCSRINSFLHSRTCFIKRTSFPFPNSSHFSVHLAQNTRITSIVCSINSVCRSKQQLTYPTVSNGGSRIISMSNYQFHSVGIRNLRHTLQDCSNYLDVGKTQRIGLYKEERNKLYSQLNKDRPTDATCFIFCSTCFECQYIHLQELATVCGYTALVRCVLALRCGSAGVMWYPYAG